MGKTSFAQQKRTFLSKQDKSKKGSIDEKILGVVKVINSQEDYYTTSSCSGRVVIWRDGKKNEGSWVKVSHDFIEESFFSLSSLDSKLLGLRVEPTIIHVCCKDLHAAVKLLDMVKPLYKKSSLISIKNKVMAEIKGSELIVMPLYDRGELLFPDVGLLARIVNMKMKEIFGKIENTEGIVKMGEIEKNRRGQKLEKEI